MNARLEVYRRADRRWAWRLVLPSGEIVEPTNSRGHARKVDALASGRSILGGDYRDASPTYFDHSRPAEGDE